MNFQVTEQNNKNLKTSKLNRCIAFTSLSPSSTTTPPPTTTLTASLRSFSLLSLNFQIQGTLFPVLSIRISTCTTSVAAWSVLTLIHNFHLFFLFFLEGVWFFLLGQWEHVGKEKKIVFFFCDCPKRFHFDHFPCCPDELFNMHCQMLNCNALDWCSGFWFRCFCIHLCMRFWRNLEILKVLLMWKTKRFLRSKYLY